MMYIFKGKELIRTKPCRYVANSSRYFSINRHNGRHPKDIPIDSYVFLVRFNQWFVKRTGKHVRLATEALVPKELKVLLLVLGVPQ